MEPEQTGAKSEGGTGSGPEVPGVRVVRKSYPKPPRLLKRFGRLCLVPESWAEAGRYPFHVTLWPLIMAVVIGAALIGIGWGQREVGKLRAFAGGYDARYAPLQLTSAGVLSWAGPVKQMINVADDAQTVVVDPTGKTKLDDIKTMSAYLVTDKELQIRSGLGEWSVSLETVAKQLMPEAGQVRIINGTTLKNFLDVNGGALFVEMFLAMFLAKIFSGGLWAALMIFTVWPLAVIAARTGEGELVIPRRAAVRFAGAVLVPLLVLDGVLEVAGYGVTATIGPQGEWFFWFGAAAVMSFWTGKMAKRMYGGKVKGKRG